MRVSGQKTKWCLLFRASAVIFVLSAAPVFAQERAAQGGNVWIYPGMETALYSISGVAFGGSLTLMYGGRTALGLRALYFVNPEDLVNILELNILFRLFLMPSDSGPFIQFSGGPALFFRQDSDKAVPADWGMISAGVSLGWRFFLGRMFLEPSIRGGYPYMAGAGLSAGVRF